MIPVYCAAAHTEKLQGVFLVVDYMEENSVAKYYDGLLLNQIKNFHEGDMSEQRKYIIALSQYICKSSEAYPYNLTYLIEQNDAFFHFLSSGKRKYDNLKEFLEQVKEVAVVQDFLKKHPQEAEKITIIYNDFLEGKLNGTICLAENFHVSGAKWSDMSDVFTVRYGQQRGSGFVSMDYEELETLICTVLDIPRSR